MEQIRQFSKVRLVLKELEETKKDVKNMSIDELMTELEIRESLYIYKSVPQLSTYVSEEENERGKARWSNEWRINDIKRAINKLKIEIK